MTLSKAQGIAALIPITLGVLAFIWNVYNYLQGADVKLLPPDQMTIGSSASVNFPLRGKGPYVHFISTMGYVNAGAAGYSSVVRRERIRVQVDGGKFFEHWWYHFVTSDSGGPKGDELKVNKKEDARPFPIMAGSSQSHETLFQPWPYKCEDAEKKCNARKNYVEWKNFVDGLHDGSKIKIILLADLFDETEPVEAECNLRITKPNIDAMNDRKWVSLPCN